jgi:hypothetical protein
MKIMYIANNPADADPLQIEREINDMQERLEVTAGTEPIVLLTYSAIEPERLAQVIKRTEPDVVHIAAHGEDGAVVFGHRDRGDVRLDGKQLATLLSVLPRRPKLVVLNACSSNEMAEQLVRFGGADFVIGTDAPISNSAARATAAALYQSLANAASIERAVAVASVHLEMLDGGAVSLHLHIAGAEGDAARTQLVDPFRLVAYFPIIDEYLDNRVTKPDKSFKPAEPNVLFGVAGSPTAARQTIIFTDDETVTGKSLEEARSWIVEVQPVNGEIWMQNHYSYCGDMNWFAAVTTTDGRVVSAASKMTAALERYYFEEQWRGGLPPEIEAVVRRSIECLKDQGGGRRNRNTATT